MCIIIDINALGPVFTSSDNQHKDFSPVYDWIYNGKGRVVFGGTKYIEELSKTKYLGLFVQLKNVSKAVLVNKEKVDSETKKISKTINNKKFNDQHLVGLLIVSKCNLICSLDKASYPYLTHPRLFTAPLKRPKIYSGKRNRDLLIDENIADICMPCCKTSKAQKKVFK